MEEIWRDIKGYEGLYQVSNLGHVKSICRSYSKSLDRTTIRIRILKYALTTKGYCQLNLCNEKGQKPFRIHRLVAEAFIPNPHNLPQVNHKDEDKTNNRADNLEWCDNKYNCTYGSLPERYSKRNTKKIAQYDLEGNFIRFWDSLAKAASFYKGSAGTLSCALRHVGYLKTWHGYKWKYV